MVMKKLLDEKAERGYDRDYGKVVYWSFHEL